MAEIDIRGSEGLCLVKPGNIKEKKRKETSDGVCALGRASSPRVSSTGGSRVSHTLVNLDISKRSTAHLQSELKSSTEVPPEILNYLFGGDKASRVCRDQK